VISCYQVLYIERGVTAFTGLVANWILIIGKNSKKGVHMEYLIRSVARIDFIDYWGGTAGKRFRLCEKLDKENS